MLTFILVVLTVVCAWYVFHLLLGLFCLAWLGTGIALDTFFHPPQRGYTQPGVCAPRPRGTLGHLAASLHLDYTIPLLLGVGPFVLLAVALLR